MVHQLGLPTLFYSLSTADTHWALLIQCLGRIVNKKLMIRNTLQKRCQQKISGNWLLVIQQYVVDTLTKEFKIFTCIMLKENSPFGVMVDYFYRVEFQQKGSPHIHGMAWIRNAPQY